MYNRYILPAAQEKPGFENCFENAEKPKKPKSGGLDLIGGIKDLLPKELELSDLLLMVILVLLLLEDEDDEILIILLAMLLGG